MHAMMEELETMCHPAVVTVRLPGKGQVLVAPVDGVDRVIGSLSDYDSDEDSDWQPMYSDAESEDGYTSDEVDDGQRIVGVRGGVVLFGGEDDGDDAVGGDGVVDEMAIVSAGPRRRWNRKSIAFVAVLALAFLVEQHFSHEFCVQHERRANQSLADLERRVAHASECPDDEPDCAQIAMIDSDNDDGDDDLGGVVDGDMLGAYQAPAVCRLRSWVSATLLPTGVHVAALTLFGVGDAKADAHEVSHKDGGQIALYVKVRDEIDLRTTKQRMVDACSCWSIKALGYRKARSRKRTYFEVFRPNIDAEATLTQVRADKKFWQLFGVSFSAWLQSQEESPFMAPFEHSNTDPSSDDRMMSYKARYIFVLPWPRPGRYTIVMKYYQVTVLADADYCKCDRDTSFMDELNSLVRTEGRIMVANSPLNNQIFYLTQQTIETRAHRRRISTHSHDDDSDDDDDEGEDEDEADDEHRHDEL